VSQPHGRIDARLGERENKHLAVIERHGLRNVHLYERGEQWIHIRDAVGALTDGTFAGDGPGPRYMVQHVKNVILASADQVAIDAGTRRGAV
jgi:hypothetical protein